MAIYPTRRDFCTAAAAALLVGMQSGTRAGAQAINQLHPDVAAIDHDRILAAAGRALTQAITPITGIAAARSPGSAHDFYSEPEDFFPDPASATAPWTQHKPSAVNPAAFTAHRDAVYALGTAVAALTAAFVLTSESRYAAKAAEHLSAWFVTPATRMTPAVPFAQRIPNAATGRAEGRFEGVLDTLPLAEVARSIRFLAASGALSAEELSSIRTWFAEYFQWLNDSLVGGLARDQKDHHASSWLFQCAAYADANVTGFTSDDSRLNTLRHRFHTVTLRAQMTAAGNFPHEVSTAYPYRNSLLNLDLLALACELLTTRFDNAWEYELQDGPGLRSAFAYHFPFLVNRAAWPYPADPVDFKLLPARRISLLLAGQAYRRPEYVDLWKLLAPLPENAAPDLRRSFPITQPLLWTARSRPRTSAALPPS
jgi:hypothetical protein